METILKKYFWIVNLMVIGVCAGFAGRAAGHLVESAYLAGDDVKQPMNRHPVMAPQQKVHAKDGETITGRDIFCSGCAPIKVEEPKPGDPISNEWTKTTLQIELVSTMYVPDDDKWSMAVIRDMTTKEKDAEMFNKGMTIGTTGATVEKVLPKRVYLLNAGKREYVDLDANAAAAPTAVAQAAPTPELGIGDISENGINCSGGNKCTIQRSVVDGLLRNTAALATSARFVPSIKDGKPNGFKLYAIRPQSIFGRIGLQNGDTIKAINGSDMTTPDAALALYTKLRNASHLSVTVDRRGETVPLDYTIVQ
ncbi:MAG TPA: type II secretion system protein GspC [Polyangia bacterium]|jgi:general secretion pathway protein C|nr:type II secretion system protein GspC [Polyangia bacterium]